MTPLATRVATEADAEAIATLVNLSYRPAGDTPGWTHESHLVAGNRIGAAGVRALLREGSAVLLHHDQGRLVACVHVEQQGDAAYIGMLTTDPALQAQGLGKRMLAAAEQHARAVFGARELRLSVLALRRDLLAWYARRGYAETGETEPFHATCGVGTPRVEGLVVKLMRKPAG